MAEPTERDRFDIEKKIYDTQWASIRHHWTQIVASLTLLTTLAAFSAVPIQLIRSGATAVAEDSVSVYVRVFVAVVIFLFGILTLLNFINHTSRSREARKVVVNIEREWHLYDENNRFVFQDPDSRYDYAKFAGREKRLSGSMIQAAYIILITLTGVGFVVFA
jgi:hypothetical protein